MCNFLNFKSLYIILNHCNLTEMGSGASRSKAPAISLAVKESRAKAAQLEKELERVEAEKLQLSKELANRSSDIEKLGEMNRILERNNQKLMAEIGTTVRPFVYSIGFDGCFLTRKSFWFLSQVMLFVFAERRNSKCRQQCW